MKNSYKNSQSSQSCLIESLREESEDDLNVEIKADKKPSAEAERQPDCYPIQLLKVERMRNWAARKRTMASKKQTSTETFKKMLCKK